MLTRPFAQRMASSIANPLPAAFLRGGTSKGIFINRAHLPDDRKLWDALFLRIMGSPDAAHGRQLDGMGGGVSSLSKIMVVGAPSVDQRAAGVDAEYTFAQVGIRDAVVDYTGNCGNLSSMIGVFAVDEDICAVRLRDDGRGTVRAWNTNTNKVVDTTFPLTDDKGTPHLDLPEVAIAGVPGTASSIVLDFLDPAGARTGALLPTGRPVDASPAPGNTPFSLVDATNPTVFVSASDLFTSPHLPPQDTYADPQILARIEHLRTAGARAMGLDPTAQAQPKIAIVAAPAAGDADADIAVHAFSMGVLHRAAPMTVALALGVAAALPGSVVHAIAPNARRLRHPSGVVHIGAEFDPDGRVRSASVVRTGRRLMQGDVWW